MHALFIIFPCARTQSGWRRPFKRDQTGSAWVNVCVRPGKASENHNRYDPGWGKKYHSQWLSSHSRLASLPPSVIRCLFSQAIFPPLRKLPDPHLSSPPVPGEAKNPLIKFICKLKYFAQIQSLPRVRVWRVEKRTFSENAFPPFLSAWSTPRETKKRKRTIFLMATGDRNAAVFFIQFLLAFLRIGFGFSL